MFEKIRSYQVLKAGDNDSHSYRHKSVGSFTDLIPAPVKLWNKPVTASEPPTGHHVVYNFGGVCGKRGAEERQSHDWLCRPRVQKSERKFIVFL